jgi:hypothetical protein
MSFSETLVYGLSFAEALRCLLALAFLAGFVMVFRPLLKGIVRATLLLVHQRVFARAELAERRSLHAQRTMALRG